MKNDYKTIHNLLISWWQGMNTHADIVSKTKHLFKTVKISEWSIFIYDFECALRDYNEDYYFQWIEYKEYAKDTAPIINGVIHNINELISGNLSQDDFINWASWHNGDGGETTSGVFENYSLEYFCLFFLPNYYKTLDDEFYKKALTIIEKSNELSYGAFVIAIHLLIESDKKSLYYFLKAFLEG